MSIGTTIALAVSWALSTCLGFIMGLNYAMLMRAREIARPERLMDAILRGESEHGDE